MFMGVISINLGWRVKRVRPESKATRQVEKSWNSSADASPAAATYRVTQGATLHIKEEQQRETRILSFLLGIDCFLYLRKKEATTTASAACVAFVCVNDDYARLSP